jgi:processive 1,2-diacylglycerol beta-glucosyltransferase
VVVAKTASNILILSSKTGGGHWSAAQALETSFKALAGSAVQVHVTQVLEEASPASHILSLVYNSLLRHRQSWMQTYFNWIEASQVNQHPWILGGAFAYVERLFNTLQPDVLVSVHPMTQHIMAYACQRMNLDIPLVTVVTDPAAGFWSGWACPGVSQYYVASQAAKNQLMLFGITPERIAIMGMPLRPGFSPTTDPVGVRQQLGLTPHDFTVLLSAGYVGGGNVPHLFNQLLAQPQGFNGQLIYLTGNNTRLHQQALQRVRRMVGPQHPLYRRIHVVPFVSDVVPWLQASDAIVTKCGGLTTLEALSCGVPILADCMTPPMPQEAEMVRFLTESNATLPINSAEEGVQLLKALSQDPSPLQAMRACGQQLVIPGAAQAIAAHIVQQQLPPLQHNLVPPAVRVQAATEPVLQYASVAAATAL